MNLGIEDRIALVTGAGRSIGRAIARALAGEGARVVLAGRTKDSLEAAREEMPGGRGRHLCVDLDLQVADAPKLLRERMRDFGTPDIIVHNLGGSLGVTDAFAPAREWAGVWQFNVGIAHDLNRSFIPDMVSRQWGRIVHLSTLSTQTHDGYPAYVSAKCALEGYVKSMSRQTSRHNVIINALAPGLVRLEGRHFARMQAENPAAIERYFEEHLPIRRMASAEEVAVLATMLCSEHAAFMPGSILRADGGGH